MGKPTKSAWDQIIIDPTVTGFEAVRKEWGPKYTMLWKRDLFIRLTKDIKHNESNKDDQDGGGVPRRITQYSHEGVNTRTWNSDDIRDIMMIDDTSVCYDTSGRLRHFWNATTLLVCYDTSGMLRHFWYATTLLVCYDTFGMLQHF